MIKKLRVDWAAHAAFGMAAALLLSPLGFIPAAGAAWGLGLWKEWRDDKANEAAEAMDQPAPHSVDPLDMVATGLPGTLVAGFCSAVYGAPWVVIGFPL